MYLETRRLVIRRLTDGDLSDWLEYAMEPESCRMRGTEAYTDHRQAREAFEWMLTHEKRVYAIVLRDERKCVGHLVVYNYPSISREPELAGMTGRGLSFCVSDRYRRRGIASEAILATVDYLFNRRGIDYISSGYFDFNAPSRSLHEKLGFTVVSRESVVLPTGETATSLETVLFNPNAPKTLTGRVSEK